MPGFARSQVKKLVVFWINEFGGMTSGEMEIATIDIILIYFAFAQSRSLHNAESHSRLS